MCVCYSRARVCVCGSNERIKKSAPHNFCLEKNEFEQFFFRFSFLCQVRFEWQLFSCCVSPSNRQYLCVYLCGENRYFLSFALCRKFNWRSSSCHWLSCAYGSISRKKRCRTKQTWHYTHTHIRLHTRTQWSKSKTALGPISLYLFVYKVNVIMILSSSFIAILCNLHLTSR